MLALVFALRDRSRVLALLECSSIFEKKKETTSVCRLIKYRERFENKNRGEFVDCEPWLSRSAIALARFLYSPARRFSKGIRKQRLWKVEPRSHFIGRLSMIVRVNVVHVVVSRQLMVWTDVIQLTLTLKMTIAQVVKTSVTVNNNSLIQEYVHPDDHTQPTYVIKYS